MNTAIWSLIDARIRRAVAARGWPLRGVLTGVREGMRVALATVELHREQVQDEVELAQHFGFASQPPAKTEVITVAIGGASSHRVVVAEMDRDTSRPTDLASGDACIYSSATGARVWVGADGAITIQAASGQQVNVVAASGVRLNGPGASVGRVGDSVAASVAMAAWMTAVVAAINALSLGAPVVVPGVPPGTLGTIATGSSSVTAGG